MDELLESLMVELKEMKLDLSMAGLKEGHLVDMMANEGTVALLDACWEYLMVLWLEFSREV